MGMAAGPLKEYVYGLNYGWLLQPRTVHIHAAASGGFMQDSILSSWPYYLQREEDG